MNKKLLSLLFASVVLLTACGEGEAEESETEVVEEATTSDLIEQAKEAEELPKGIVFTKGVDDGYVHGTEENYMEVAGTVDNADQVIVVYNTTVIDILEVDENGYFEYYSKGSDTGTELYFGTNEDATHGTQLEPHEIENRADIYYLPAEPEEQEDEEVTFKIGETVYFESGLELTITEATLSDEKPNGEINHNFVRVDFTVDNQTGEPYNFTNHEIELYDGERNKAELNAKNYYSETIAVGMKGNGSAYFDSVSTDPFTVIIGPAIWESE